MNWRRLKFKHGRKVAVALLMLSIALLDLLYLVRPVMANTGITGVAADTLTIKVGYFGGPYYIKKVYTLSDLEALPQVRQAYTYIDSMPAVVIDSAEGVKLTDILVDAGIDANSVQKFYFYSSDVKTGWYQCLDKTYLLDTTRYYYPNLPSSWNYEIQNTVPDAVYGSVQVPALIAHKDNWHRFATAPDFSLYDTSTRFRLMLGQSDPTEMTAPKSVKWVHAIEVMLGGTPPSGISLDQDIVNLKVGSTVQLTAIVGPDDATDKSVTWSSSDTKVATVDKNGLVTVVGPGTAAITVSTLVGNFTATTIVNGLEQDVDHSTGSAGSLNYEAHEESEGTSKPEDNRLYLRTDKEEIEAATKSSEIPLKEAGNQPWRVFKMSADAVPMQKQAESNNLDIYAAALFLGLLLLGASKGYAEYIMEVKTRC